MVKRKPGRPRIGATPVNVRFPPDQLEKLDTYAKGSKPKLTRPEAVRAIVAKQLDK